MSRDRQDYSGTPLATKLGIKSGHRVLFDRAPAGFDGHVAPLPDGVTVVQRVTRPLDVAVIFTTELGRLHARLPVVQRALALDGGLWIAWPKKAAKVATDVTFHHVQRAGLAGGLVDNKSCSIDPVYQAMRFVYRLKDRRSV